jgi:RHS repeat-associated protein
MTQMAPFQGNLTSTEPPDMGGSASVATGNRLTALHRTSDNALIASYRYDYASRRVEKKTPAAAAGGVSQWRFIYEGWNLLGEYHVESPETPTAPATLTLCRSHDWGLDVSGSWQGAGGVGGLLRTQVRPLGSTTWTAYRPLYDGNGTIIAYATAPTYPTSTTPAIAATLTYDPFGHPITLTGSPAVLSQLPYRFSTKYHDAETGMAYYGYRYYDSGMGRWVSWDPIGEMG